MNDKTRHWQFVSTNIQLSGTVDLDFKSFPNTLIFVLLLLCGLISPMFEEMLLRISEALKQKYNDK